MNDKPEILVIASDPETRKALSSILQTEGLKSVTRRSSAKAARYWPANVLAWFSANGISRMARTSIFCRRRRRKPATFPLS